MPKQNEAGEPPRAQRGAEEGMRADRDSSAAPTAVASSFFTTDQSCYPIIHPAQANIGRGLCALGVMTKAPRPGKVKTRLVPPLTGAEAAALNTCFLRDTTENIAAIARAGGAAGVAVYTPVGDEAAFDDLLPDGFRMLAQRGDLFGDRLFYAAADLLAAGFDSVCLIDSDSPTMPAAALITAVEVLQRPGDRMVLGPSDDGGYYLIGLKRAHRRVFEAITWSTASVAAETHARAAEIGLEVVLLPVWYDVDDAATLKHLCDELFGMPGQPLGYPASHTHRYLRQLIQTEGRERIWPVSAKQSGHSAA